MRKITTILLLLMSCQLFAGQVVVDNLRIWAAPDHTRLVFDTSDPVNHNIFTLKQPDRLVIDIQNAKLTGKIPEAENNSLIKQLRSAQRKDGSLRVVLDLSAHTSPKSFVLKPNSQYGHRLVVDLYGDADTPSNSRAQKTVKQTVQSGLRDVVIAIDAGHGGEDPGAKGRRGTYEKHVVLSIARKLATMIENERGMKAVMVRDGDYYLGLRKRMDLARSHRADLFVSIHADSFRDPRARGSSVYTLSNRGASSEAARWLAESENSADLIGGVKLEDKDDVLASVLLDLSQTGTRQASHDVANKVLGQLKTVGRTHKSAVQQAGFAVLKSPDVPSILVETAFISNPEEERKLLNPRHQEKVARAILTGLRGYFRNSPPPGTLMASLKSRKHTISRGDTLGRIADQYDISLASLKSANGISSDIIRIGQVLVIPGT
ncbi:N-acetylmuramoyl-L-alanine amidase [Sedimenticola selenatireducens]|uniref:N-acetylmuramoyl-L-alanine amidase AmiC n=1 Tax=Sedimenticola selenatireducens TaxID=191960 RepID=A0A557SF01_9GAMM|nr:N-acetylmuramoyl-L-alanine amidase [Sedimenticola selenatireducens]TVO75964.1 AMIN domain-containing protein [Sedimenticola selenatireducens]TVT63823.1 MAG: AMIN domain-containing protein [Sedimenticola selenatireducens]